MTPQVSERADELTHEQPPKLTLSIRAGFAKMSPSEREEFIRKSSVSQGVTPKREIIDPLKNAVFHHEKVVKELVEGEYFGEICLVLNTSRTCNVRAKNNTFCELQILHRTDFDSVVLEFEDERKVLEEIIMEKVRERSELVTTSVWVAVSLRSQLANYH